MAKKKEILVNGQLTPVTEFDYSAAQIEEAVRRVLAGYLELGCAPAGYGLGTFGKRLTESDDLNSVWACGFYWWSTAPANAPFTYGAMVVKSRATDVYVQEITCLTAANTANAGTRVQRINYAGMITPDEWVNPPMLFGVEYRTTERCDGKPVYAKRVSGGTYVQNGSFKFGSANVATVIRYDANIGSMGNPWISSTSLTNDYTNCVRVSVEAGDVAASMYGGTASYGVVSVTAYYTKTTD